MSDCDRLTEEELDKVIDEFEEFGTVDCILGERLLDEIVALRNDVRTFYHADGTAEVLATAEEVVKRRKAAAREIERLRDALAFVADKLDYLQNLWGAEGVTRTIADRVRAALAPDTHERTA